MLTDSAEYEWEITLPVCFPNQVISMEDFCCQLLWGGVCFCDCSLLVTSTVSYQQVSRTWQPGKLWMLLMYLTRNMKGHQNTKPQRHPDLDLIKGGTLQIRSGISRKDRMIHIIPLKGLRSQKKFFFQCCPGRKVCPAMTKESPWSMLLKETHTS